MKIYFGADQQDIIAEASVDDVISVEDFLKDLNVDEEGRPDFKADAADVRL